MKMQPLIDGVGPLLGRVSYFLVHKTGGPRTRIAGGVLLLAVSSLVSFTCNPVVRDARVPGLVLEIDALGIVPEGELQPHARILIAVGDSSQTHILLPPPVPRPGDFIPLLAKVHRKGDIDYSLDLEKWVREGPS